VSDRAHAELFAERVSSLPEVVARFLDAPGRLPTLGQSGAIVTTGVGSSEAPARRCAALARRAGRAAVFAPISAFATGSAPAGAELVVFSQGLSPNAGLALAAAAAFSRVRLFTSIAPGCARARERGLHVAMDAGVDVVVLPPAQEDGLLARVIGPVVASLAAHLAVRQGEPAALPDPKACGVPQAMADAAAATPHLAVPTAARPAALVACSDQLELSFGAANAWLEGLREPPPFAWDVLGLAHGPLQMAHARPLLALALERGAVAAEAHLFDRLARALPKPHEVLRLRATLPPALAWIEHEVAVLQIVARELAARPRDLGWGPGREDQPLYELGAHPPEAPPASAGEAPRQLAPELAGELARDDLSK
jgi:creatinine amidohydrolase